MKLIEEEIRASLDELENVFLRVGAERCKCLEEASQHSAFLRLGVRAVSLLRGMLPLLRSDTLDSYDAVRRAFLETWQLQFEFRLTSGGPKVAKWFAGQPGSWNLDFGRTANFIESLGRERPQYGREYGDLSELAHPTAAATANSCAVASVRRGMSSAAREIETALAEFAEDHTGLLIREIWIVDACGQDLIDVHIQPSQIPSCEALFDRFRASRH